MSLCTGKACDDGISARGAPLLVDLYTVDDDGAVDAAPFSTSVVLDEAFPEVDERAVAEADLRQFGEHTVDAGNGLMFVARRCAPSRDPGTGLVDRVYTAHGTYAEHLKRGGADPIGAFIDRVRNAPGDAPSADGVPSGLYDRYREYCDREGLLPVTRRSMLSAEHGLAGARNGAAQGLGGFPADKLRGVAPAHLGEHGFEVPGEPALEGAEQRFRRFGIDRPERHGHVGEGLVQQGIGDAGRQGRDVRILVAHRNLNVLSLSVWRMLRAGSRVSGAIRHSISHRLRASASDLRDECREVGRIARHFWREAMAVGWPALRRDASAAVAVALFALGFPMGVLALVGVVLR